MIKKVEKLILKYYESIIFKILEYFPLSLHQIDKFLYYKRLSTKFKAYNNVGTIEILQQEISRVSENLDSNRFLHHRWLGIYNDTNSVLESNNIQLPSNYTYMCLGAGHRNTFALPLFHGLGGAQKIHVVEPQDLNIESVTYGIKDIILRLSLGDFSEKSLDISRLSMFIKKEGFLKFMGIDKLLNDDNIHYHKDYLENLKILNKSVDLISSRSVLEHILEIDRSIEEMRKILKSGSAMLHDIDLSSHDRSNPYRHYSKIYSGKKTFDRLNGLLLKDYLGLFDKHGFKSRVIEKYTTNKPLNRDSLHPKYRDFSDEELQVKQAKILCIAD